MKLVKKYSMNIIFYLGGDVTTPSINYLENDMLFVLKMILNLTETYLIKITPIFKTIL